MGRVISGWTDRHVPVALALVVAALTGMVAGAEPAQYQVVTAVAILVTVPIGLSLDAFGGIVAGLAAAAGSVAVKQLTGGWTQQGLPVSAAAIVALIVLGWVSGLVNRRIRSGGEGDPASDDLVAPAHGSLGLLSPEVGMTLLDEEVARARQHRRPLSLVVLRTGVTDPGLDQAARQAATRSVARLVEARLRETDVPFAFAPEEVGAILPETDGDSAWELLGPLVDAVMAADFTVREEEQRRAFVDCADLHVGVAVLAPDHADGQELLAAARLAIDPSR